MSDHLSTGHITILGGGPAGLSAGYYARKNHLSFSIYEAKNYVGGNSITINHGNFLFDSGPHLLQTKDVETRTEITELLQGELNKIILPLHTYVEGKLVDFPFSSLNLLTTMGSRFVVRAMFEIVAEKFSMDVKSRSFESYAIRSYGKSIANRMLLNYSKKLWGKSGSELSPRIAGQQLRGLDLKTFLIELFRGRTARVEHLGGTMYYPKRGFGMIADKLAESCAKENIHTGSRITAILHEHRRIHSIELNHEERVNTEQVLSTLPPNMLVRLMRPTVPEDILAIAESLHFRSLVLVALFLDRPSVTASGSIHFPDPQLPFTRIHEPKNRSRYMAPKDQTSLIAEIPCQEGDKVWNLQDRMLIQLVKSKIEEIQWIKDREVINGRVVRLNDAYPILDVDYEQKIQRLRAYLDTFSNLKITGRTGAFAYLSLHHIMESSSKIMTSYSREKDDEHILFPKISGTFV